MECAITQLTWGELYQAAGLLWERQKGKGWQYIYGVPRGGCSAALLVQSLAHRDGQSIMVLDEPDAAGTTLIVDDIVDSGKTLRPFIDQEYTVDALYRSRQAPKEIAPHAVRVNGWITFPFERNERNEGTGAEDLVIRLLQFIGEDPNRDGLKDTPKRVLKAWKEMTVGYGQDPKAILSRSFDQSHDELILLRGVRFTSCCEHHLLPFTGTAAIGYIPSPTGGVVGISKLARVLECFARRLQLQERLTKQVADAITEALSPLGVGVVIRASHSCMSCRGCLQPDSDLITSVMTGMLRDSTPARAEFLSLVNL